MKKRGLRGIGIGTRKVEVERATIRARGAEAPPKKEEDANKKLVQGRGVLQRRWAGNYNKDAQYQVGDIVRMPNGAFNLRIGGNNWTAISTDAAQVAIQDARTADDADDFTHIQRLSDVVTGRTSTANASGAAPQQVNVARSSTLPPAARTIAEAFSNADNAQARARPSGAQDSDRIAREMGEFLDRQVMEDIRTDVRESLRGADVTFDRNGGERISYSIPLRQDVGVVASASRDIMEFRVREEAIQNGSEPADVRAASRFEDMLERMTPTINFMRMNVTPIQVYMERDIRTRETIFGCLKPVTTLIVSGYGKPSQLLEMTREAVEQDMTQAAINCTRRMAGGLELASVDKVALNGRTHYFVTYHERGNRNAGHLFVASQNCRSVFRSIRYTVEVPLAQAWGNAIAAIKEAMEIDPHGN